ncbi:hypothetical protein L3X38_019012 [Prunus dulcis]|uniref:RNase H type-1 domain-containing protein n=1 Tax=Prunus dulcis TaxID=3755 RepID=A0AAD4WA31_PRUDU|nr:hypothetical protein L3X38_019012 [Prunus dulcis]
MLIDAEAKPHDNAYAVLAGAKKIGRNSIIVVECLALRDGLAYVVSKGWSKLLVHGESKLVIDSVLKRCSTSSCINQLVQDIIHLTTLCDQVSFSHVFCEVNEVADALAFNGHSLSPSKLWESGLPLSIGSSFYLDLFGLACPKGSCLCWFPFSH